MQFPFDKNTVKLLRIPFSFYLMPVFLFATSRAEHLDWGNAILAFIALHIFIYPASNGYNSYFDKDETPIGGLENPPLPTRKLFWASNIFDAIGLAISAFVDVRFFGLLLLYVLASRAYSSYPIRLKSKPFAGFLVVILFQGAVTFMFTYLAVSGLTFQDLLTHFNGMAASTMLIAGVYPLTQIYQHEADSAAGDITISQLLGYKGTFIFSGVMFGLAAALIYSEFYTFQQTSMFLVFGLFLLPVIAYFTWWQLKVWGNTAAANFKNTMRMNSIASICMNACFATLIYFSLFK